MLRRIGVVISVGLADALNPSTVGSALFLASKRYARETPIRYPCTAPEGDLGE
jgi:hypothetical protein